MVSGKLKMDQEDKQQEKDEKKRGKEEVAVSAPLSEWKDIESLVTSYRQQCKAMHHFTSKLERLTHFQQRLTQATGGKSPDDYFI